MIQCMHACSCRHSKHRSVNKTAVLSAVARKPRDAVVNFDVGLHNLALDIT